MKPTSNGRKGVQGGRGRVKKGKGWKERRRDLLDEYQTASYALAANK